MGTNLTGKTAFIFALLVVFGYGIFGIPRSLGPKGLKQALTDRIKLGLDLRGGTHLVLQVIVADAVNAVTDNDVQRLQADFDKNQLVASSIAKLDPDHHPEIITVAGTPPEKSSDVRGLLEGGNYGNYVVTPGPDNTWVLTMKHQEVIGIQAHAVTQSIETIRERIDSLGVASPPSRSTDWARTEILVELPGVDDPARVKDVIQSTAQPRDSSVIGDASYSSEAEALQSIGGMLPPDEELLHGNGVVGAEGDRVWVLKRAPSSRQRLPRRPTIHRRERPPRHHFNLTTEAGNTFYKYTYAHSKTAARIDGHRARQQVQRGRTISPPSATADGSRRLHQGQVDNLSLMLRTGALPASIRILEDPHRGPVARRSLHPPGRGRRHRRHPGVMAFMLLYYRGAGINADLALFLNLVILLGFMGFTGATLTLPGIAGVILTIGMGVDSNVLIFERIREELRAGKVPAAAVEQGFAHAWVTIVDTHVTTIVSAAILFLFGTGPVNGFAVTLTFGLAGQPLPAVFVSRVIFDSILQRKQRGEALSI